MVDLQRKTPGFLSKCTAEQIYNVFQGREKQDCLKAPRSQQRECKQRAEENFKDYKDAKDEVKEY